MIGRQSWMLLAGALLLSFVVGCQSDSPSERLPSEDDAAPVVGSPGGSVTQPIVTFLTDEDTPLNGFFYDPTSFDQLAHRDVTISELPAHGLLEFGKDRDDFIYTPNIDYFGSDDFTYVTSGGLPVRAHLVIQPINDAPVIDRELPRVAEQGVAYVARITAFDADGDSDILQFSADGLPDWLILNAATGELNGTPTQNDIGFFRGITFRVTDESGVFDELTGVSIEVIDVNDAPVINTDGFPRQLRGGQTLSIQVFPDDPEGTPVTLQAEPNRFVDVMFDGGVVILQVADVAEVTEINLVLLAIDEAGTVERVEIPIDLLPVSASGEGVTLKGTRQGRGVHLVILGDGYRQDQQDLLMEHAEQLMDYMAQDAGIRSHLDAFNIHIVPVVSEDSGADDNELIDSRDTFFDAAYNCGGVLRLICADSVALFDLALAEYPWLDQLLLLVNDRRYGGSGNTGGALAMLSAYYPEIALHELGHSFAGLADEYVDQNLQTFEAAETSVFSYANVSNSDDRAAVPWSHWIGETAECGPPGSIVDVFEGANYRERGAYRPTVTSRMREFDQPFCVVNSEQWILRLYEETEGIRGLSPLATRIDAAEGDRLTFQVVPFFEEGIQAVEWSLDGIPVNAGNVRGELTLTAPAGEHMLQLTVTDVSGAIRLPEPHAGVFTRTWELDIR